MRFILKILRGLNEFINDVADEITDAPIVLPPHSRPRGGVIIVHAKIDEPERTPSKAMSFMRKFLAALYNGWWTGFYTFIEELKEPTETEMDEERFLSEEEVEYILETMRARGELKFADEDELRKACSVMLHDELTDIVVMYWKRNQEN